MPVAGGAAGSEDDVTEPSGDTSPAPHDAPTHPLDPWGLWIVRWLGAMLTVSFLATTVLLALDRGGWGVAWIVLWALPIAWLVAGFMTFVAATLRWLLSRYTPPRLQDAILPVVILGALAGAAPLWLFLFGGDPTAFTGRTLRVAFGFIFPAGLGGGMASYLAERQVSVRSPQWWTATISAGLAGGFGSAWPLLG
jgi:hypothetical protein